MNSFILPKFINNIDKLTCKYSNLECPSDGCYISKTLNKYLNDIKHQINDHIIEWDSYKKYTNPYEYIHSIVPRYNHSISRIKPLSRSFYKMVEIVSLFELQYLLNRDFQSFHLAEGPGGFIEALAFLKKLSNQSSNNTNTNTNTISHYGMTLQSSDVDVPSWKKSQDFLKKNPQVIIENGPSKTGDLFRLDNLKYCYTSYYNSMDMITGDGGFDFSLDYDNQEHSSIKLIFAQICFAIMMQKVGGIFILKIFDIFTRPTVELLFLLANLYDSVYIIKPYTSRIANSEKYIVCKGFRGVSGDFITNILSVFREVMDEKNGKQISGLLDIEIPYLFINKLEEYNAIFGQQQMENINNTINKIINREQFNDEYIKSNIQKCLFWCEKHKIPYYTEFT